ncbi:glutamine-hydrolyzing carbamoyl-phosphate synthase small subunit [Synechococcus sp. M16CYN]|uniref:glutamine-hydrolyzing carbamoyl-phosphate synthase small subunit n=1 Tax=Synechococcus sp. M16CYN TaxID=3103139 RepID=UPI0032434109
MPDFPSSEAHLVLADGTVLSGAGFGHRGAAMGEVVFNTAMTGYQEVLTDPSYEGQLVAFAYPELGNTGVNADDQEASMPHARGVIARQLAPCPSNWRSQGSLESWMRDHQIVGILGVDTRALIRHLRDRGAMNGVICTKGSRPITLLDELRAAPSMEGYDLASCVSTTKSYRWTDTCRVDFDRRLQAKPSRPFQVVAIDFGIKRAILDRLVAHGCEVTVLPMNSDIATVRSHKPDGVFLSNGPGDPAAVTKGIALAKALLEEKDLPMFGICLGHQILGLALGGSTFKLAYGHRGLNHPCGITGQVEITSQNHGFALDSHSLMSDQIDITHFNLNDQTVAAIAHRSKPVFSVQYHPEASPGPHDADHHFSRFVALMSDCRRGGG